MISDVTSPPPQASFEFTPDDSTGDIIVTKKSGDAFDGDEVKFSGAALEKNTYGSITEWSGNEVKAGDSATVDVSPGQTLTLIWRSPEGDETAVLTKYDVPNDVGPTASIGSINVNTVNDRVTVNNIQFTRTDKVWIVVDDEGSNIQTDFPTQEQYVSTSGETLSFDPPGGFQIGPSETVTVTLYATDSKNNQLAIDTASG